ncbi:Sugar transferase involved in LPS biosynthesis (colanic, teichoic acid) [Trichlorobacter thiogenes]|uniref:Sugar transferase involved in LPS biosynthesis (Colanic, teichoic acid) n=1 Tax=Trichlorobacter thiogenes TaxID=115783 RepID=A0A1T4MN92_9BACT|nr:sugar transferase [Trichlorobacter thiogenes]SJZ68307.1 Sugar transferase involved in LPS biosynthesis (colanic, teichoic acid) [Trichlorobacter thiogenes]
MLAKRLFDLLFTIPGFLLLAPFMLIIAIWIRLDSKGPVFFRQERVGQSGKPFRILKFRTMCIDAEAKGRQITVGNDPRITKSGTFLRKYKLDELPQLLNVIKGEMSLVGPRPEVPRYVAMYPEDTRQIVLSVPPGITDFASIEYKDENDILGAAANPDKAYIEEILPAKLGYYLRYVQTRSLKLDFMLIVKVLPQNLWVTDLPKMV